jgi:hypothetical protein
MRQSIEAEEASMQQAVIKVTLIGVVAFAVLSCLEKIPVLGWFGGLVSLGLWAYLASRLVEEARSSLEAEANPSIPAMSFAALVGGVSALAGAIVSFALDAILANAAANAGNGVAALGNSINATGSLMGMLYWPFVGVLVCGLFGLIWGGRVQGSATSQPLKQEASIPVGTLSPDGVRFWNGTTWQPVEVTEAPRAT